MTLANYKYFNGFDMPLPYNNYYRVEKKGGKMRITQLIEQLEKMKKDVGPKVRVSVAAKKMLNFCVENVESKCVNVFDRDGFPIINKDGSERVRSEVILS